VVRKHYRGVFLHPLHLPGEDIGHKVEI
jgi:hypothetical protein